MAHLMKLAVAWLWTTLGTLAYAGSPVGKVAMLRRGVRVRSISSTHDQQNATQGLIPKAAPFDSPYNINPKRCASGFFHVGCTQDTQKDQRRYYTDVVPKEDRLPMTVQLCWQFCKNVSGAQFFALENGDRCYCTPVYVDGKDYADKMCDMPCVGNPAEMCGNQRLQDMYEMHDCSNKPPVPCKYPPQPVQNAKLFKSNGYYGVMTPCKNARKLPLDTVRGSLCEVECEEGYTLTENTLRCVEQGDRSVYSWAQFTGRAVCSPVRCGTPPPLDHSSFPRAEAFYTDVVDYDCSLGYAVGAEAAGLKQQDSTCQSDAKFSEVKTCEPVKCGPCPTGEGFKHAVPQEKGPRVYQEGCTYRCDTGFTLNGRADGRTSFVVNCMYNGEFEAPPHCTEVICGAVPTAANAEPAMQLEPGYQGKFNDTIAYNCKAGYTLSGIVNELAIFEATCTAKGYWAGVQECKPVLIGRPPAVANAEYPDQPYYYGESCTYKCKTGYTQNGKVDGPTVYSLQTSSNGQWQGSPPPCLPVECGAPPAYNKASVQGVPPAVVNYDSPALQYKCNPGYSTDAGDDIWQPNKVSFITSCQANGQFTTVPSCVNINDCLARSCGAYGACVDNPDPTGNLQDDYSCACLSGYETVLVPSPQGELLKKCVNINDCPTGADACGGVNAEGIPRGFCEDGLNTYTCTPSSGYQVAKLPAPLASNDTCVPVSCGTVPTLANAVSEPDLFGKPANFDTPPWQVHCNEGYSLDGTVTGATSYPMSCQDSGQFTPTKPCTKISCGSPKTYAYSDIQPKILNMLYQDQVSYACDEGYALLGDKNGVKTFTMTCTKTGKITYDGAAPGGPASEDYSCLPVVCGKAPAQQFATLDTTTDFVFGQSATVNCDSGFSTDGSTNDASFSYKLPCLASGAFGTGPSCQRVVCPNLPIIAHSTHTPAGPFVFEDTVTYTLEPGFTMDVPGKGKIEGSFTCHCTESGRFNGTCAGTDLTVKAIDCGDAPAVAYAKVTGETTFGGLLTARAFPGYTVDGTPQGATSFTFSCQADHRFSPRQEFQPIKCGLLQDYDNVLQNTITRYPGPSTAVPELLELNSTPVVHGDKHQLKVRSLAAQGKSKVRHGRKRVETLYYGDQVEYVCIEGYHVAPSAGALLKPLIAVVPVAAPTTFTTQCAATGDVVLVTATGQVTSQAPDVGCLPVTCDVPGDFTWIHKGHCSDGWMGENTAQPDVNACAANCRGRSAAYFAFTNDATVVNNCACYTQCPGDNNFPSYDAYRLEEPSTETALPVLAAGTARLTYKMQQSFTCVPGYSVDGTPAGATGFVETVQANGQLTSTSTCKDIDWCLDSQCGAHGTCVDGVLSYTCKCELGYGVTVVGGKQTCTEINECETQSGNAACAVGGGQCVDGIAKYTCTCVAGYENVRTSLGLDSCSPVVCGTTPVKGNATSEQVGQKLSYPAVATYACNSGYTIDGEPTGSQAFSVSCQTDGSFSGQQYACLPVACPPLPELALATTTSTKLVAFESATYTCAEGATTTGIVGGSDTFEINCRADGTFSDGGECQPISCGVPPTLASTSAGEPMEMFYQDTITYVCADGYSLDGTAAGGTDFQVACQADGTFSGIQTCQAVQCGTFPIIDNSLTPARQLSYPSKLDVDCSAGYTTDGTPSGAASFVVSCGMNGKYQGVLKCSPVSCGSPQSTAASTVPPEKKEFRSLATWTCKPGYSLDGTATGGTQYTRRCGADGLFSVSSPVDCKDINYCLTSPCGANGVCTDAGAGVTSPGYTCTCFEGFELKSGSGGAPFCGADDCAGNPCGDGGSCQDLSKSGGPQGAYTCACSSGFSLKEKNDGTLTCVRVVCGLLPVVNNAALTDTFPYTVTTWKGGPAEVDAFYGRYILKSFDKATYTCQTGYSTDGQNTPESKTFTVSCGATGTFSTAVSPTSSCLPIVCDRPFLPAVNKAVCLNSTSTIFTFGQTALYKCMAGYTLDGTLAGDTYKAFVCQANGRFDSAPMSCIPTPCQVPSLPNATASALTLSYGGKVTYSCSTGYYVGGIVAADTGSFTGTCQADGTLTYSAAGVGTQGCLPCNCGTVPTQPNVATPTLFLQGADGVKYEQAPVALKYTQTVGYTCLDGHTLGGELDGQTTYQVTCTSTGLLTGRLFLNGSPIPGGPPVSAPGPCDKPTLEVSGLVTDAQDAGIFIEGARVTFRNSAGTVVATATTDSYGVYTVSPPPGDLTVRVEKDVAFFKTAPQSYCWTGVIITSLADCQQAVADLGYDWGDQVSLPNGHANCYISDNIRLGFFNTRGAATPPSASLSAVCKGRYIPTEANLTVTTSLKPGQGADLYLSKPLPPDGWRIVLSWGKDPEDLDSHTLFGCNYNKEVFFPDNDRKYTSSDAGGVTVVLDRDDTDGYGPETTTITGTGNCVTAGCCLAQFKVHLYNGTGTLADSDASVLVFRGEQKVGSYKVPACLPAAQTWWTVFTLDFTANIPYASALQDGDRSLGPYVSADYKRTDSKSAAGPVYYKAPPSSAFQLSLLYGITAVTSLYVYEVQGGGAYDELANCTEVDWSNMNVVGKFGTMMTCPTGFFVNGLYRTATITSTAATGKITKAQCCRPQVDPSVPPAWGTCVDQALDSSMFGKCPVISGVPSLIVGMKAKNNGAGTSVIPKPDGVRCCTMPRYPGVLGWPACPAMI